MGPLPLESKLVPFSLPGTDEKTYSADQYRQAKILGVVFTCNHCPYAKAWEDRLINAQRDFAKSGVQMLLINSNDPAKFPDDSFENMKRRSKEKGYPFPYLFDESQEVAKSYGATRTPEVFLFDAGRVLRYHGAPDDNFEDPSAVTHHYLRDAIQALIAGRRPDTTDTKVIGCTIKWK
jgi:peroxiredoxin